MTFNSLKLYLALACLALASLVTHAQSAVVGLPGGFVNGSITLENVYAAPGSFTFAHNLNSIFVQVTCGTRTGTSSYAPATVTVQWSDANNTIITVPAAGDYICAFSSVKALQPDFTLALSPSSLTFWPTMTGTQNAAFTLTQGAISSYSGTATYSTSGLASGMSGAYSPTTVTGGGSTTLTVSFPASQAAATTAFTAQGSDGTKTHIVSPSITVGNINSGLVEGWQLNDGSGTTFADGAGTSNTETIQTGSCTWASNAGLPGTTCTLSSTGYASGANQTATNFDGTTPFSVSSWIKLGGTINFRTIASTLDSANNFVGWEFSVDATGGPFHLHGFLVNNYGGGNAIEVNTTNTVSLSTLHYVVMTYDGLKSGTTSVKFYLDGVLCTNNTPLANTLTGSIANTKPVSLGGRPSGGSQPLNGLEAYTRIYNRVLSSTDVANYYSAGAR